MVNLGYGKVEGCIDSYAEGDRAVEGEGGCGYSVACFPFGTDGSQGGESLDWGIAEQILSFMHY